MTSSLRSRMRARAVRHSQPIYWREAAICVPAMPVILLAGAATGHIVEAAIAAGAAFSVGFGAARDLRGRRWGAMIAAALGMTVAAFVGSLFGESFVLFLILAAIAAAACAATALIDEDLWWVALQVVVFLLIAGYYAGPPAEALTRALAVLAGGAAQLVSVVVLAKLVPRAAGRLPGNPARYEADRTLLIVHMVRAAVCVSLSLALAHGLGLANSYWAPMTAMIVLKPGLRETQARGLARLGGTITGCVVAGLFAVAVGHSEPLLVVGVAVTAGAAFAVQKAHYATLTCAITATVVLLLSLGHGGVLANAEHRLIATVIGGVMALLIAGVAPRRHARIAGDIDRVGASRAPAGGEPGASTAR